MHPSRSVSKPPTRVQGAPWGLTEVVCSDIRPQAAAGGAAPPAGNRPQLLACHGPQRSQVSAPAADCMPPCHTQAYRSACTCLLFAASMPSWLPWALSCHRQGICTPHITRLCGCICASGNIYSSQLFCLVSIMPPHVHDHAIICSAQCAIVPMVLPSRRATALLSAWRRHPAQPVCMHSTVSCKQASAL